MDSNEVEVEKTQKSDNLDSTSNNVEEVVM